MQNIHFQVNTIALTFCYGVFLQIELDFVLIFGEKTTAKFLERWPTTFMQKVIQQG